MGLYQRWVLPGLVDLSMRQRRLAAYRNRTISKAHGTVLEVGIGSGLNLPFYGQAVERIYGIDPSHELLAMAKMRVADAHCPVSLVCASAEQLPLNSESVDTLVMTWTLCTIPDARKALLEMRRVLKPNGRLLFVEHGLSPDPHIERWQNRLTPFWKRIGGGCHLNRKMDDLVRAAGFEISEFRTGYMKGPKPMTYMYEGQAMSTRAPSQVSDGLFAATAMPDSGWWQALWPDPHKVLTALGMQPGMDAVDLCCGDGLFTVPLALVARHVVAIDLDPEVLARAKRRIASANMTNCDLVNGDAYDVAALAPGPVDFVLMANTFHGVPDKARLARAIASILGPGGRFVVVNWHRRPRGETVVLGQPRGPKTELRMEPGEVAAALAPSGLTLVNLVELLPYHYGAIFEKTARTSHGGT